jgi:hypothetical protein
MSSDQPPLPVSALPVLACSLGPDSLPDRIARWRELVASAGISRTAADGRVVLRLQSRPEVRAEVERLIEAERACCPFLQLELTGGARPADDPLVLTIQAPHGAEDTLNLFHTAELEPR